MIEPELKVELEKIDQHLQDLKKARGAGLWRSFFSGVFNALGYVVGIAIVVVILGWVLQKTGMWQQLQQQIKTFNDLANEAKKLSAPPSNYRWLGYW